MKKLFPILILALLPISIFAQNSIVRYGPKVGINVANINGNEVEKLVPTVDLVGGAFVEVFATDWLSFSLEAIYSGQGANVKGENTTLDIDYIKAPILVAFYPVKGLGIRTGFDTGYLIIADFMSDGQRIEMKDVFNKFDMSIPVGVSYTFDFGLTMEARYNFGVSNILANETNLKAYNNVFSFTVGWKF